jgi:hypothetical protein
MKRAALLLILTMFLNVSAGAQSQNDRTRMGLLGPVKTMEFGLVQYALKENKPTAGGRVPFQQVDFNTEGNKTAESVFQDGALSSRYVYTYDSSGVNTGYEETYRTPEKTFSRPRKHQYLTDSRGNIAQYTVYDSDGTMSIRFVYLYNQAGQKTEEQVFYHTGALGSRTLHSYDGAGNEIETSSYDQAGTVGWKQNLKYDDQGRRIELLQFAGEVLRYRILTTYDDKGRPTQEETIELNGKPGSLRPSHSPVPGKIVYRYDDEKRTKDVSTYDDAGALKGRLIYAYDEKGSEIKKTEFNPDGSPKYQEIMWYEKSRLLRRVRGDSSIRIEYDANGNWITKTYLLLLPNSREAEVYGSEYRTIVYY